MTLIEYGVIIAGCFFGGVLMAKVENWWKQPGKPPVVRPTRHVYRPPLAEVIRLDVNRTDLHSVQINEYEEAYKSEIVKLRAAIERKDRQLARAMTLISIAGKTSPFSVWCGEAQALKTELREENQNAPV